MPRNGHWLFRSHGSQIHPQCTGIVHHFMCFGRGPMLQMDSKDWQRGCSPACSVSARARARVLCVCPLWCARTRVFLVFVFTDVVRPVVRGPPWFPAQSVFVCVCHVRLHAGPPTSVDARVCPCPWGGGGHSGEGYGRSRVRPSGPQPELRSILSGGLVGMSKSGHCRGATPSGSVGQTPNERACASDRSPISSPLHDFHFVFLRLGGGGGWIGRSCPGPRMIIPPPPPPLPPGVCTQWPGPNNGPLGLWGLLLGQGGPAARRSGAKARHAAVWGHA